MGGGQAHLTVCQSCMVALLSAGCSLSLTFAVGSGIWAVRRRGTSDFCFCFPVLHPLRLLMVLGLAGVW